jgi:hypothetical protein
LTGGTSSQGVGEKNEISGFQAKKITNFTTAAFDPKWAGDNKILFASYENGGINVRMIKNVDDLIVTPDTSRPIVYDKIKDLWFVNKIKGVPQKMS